MYECVWLNGCTKCCLAMPFRKTWHITMWLVCCSELLRVSTNAWQFILYDIHNYCIPGCQIIKSNNLLKTNFNKLGHETRANLLLDCHIKDHFSFTTILKAYNIQYTSNISEKHVKVTVLWNRNLLRSTWKRDEVIRGAFALGIGNNLVSA